MREGKIEGTEVRRIYQAHGKDDEAGAVKEILAAAQRIEGTEKKKITLADLDRLSSKTIAVRDSAAIKKGLGILFDYYSKHSEQVGEDKELDLDIMDIFERLSKKNGETIIDIFESEVAAILKGDDDETLGYRKAE
jgi:hypothetical protein